MKRPKNESSLMESISLATEDLVNCIDLDEIQIPAEIVREIQKLTHSGDTEAAKDLYVSSVLNGVHASEEKQWLAEWARSKGGVNRGAQKTQEFNQIRQWLYPLLTECDEKLPLERKHRGWKTMQAAAKKKLNSENMDDPRKNLITQARIQAWIEQDRPKK